MKIRITLTTLHGHTDRQDIDVDLLGTTELEFDLEASAHISGAVKLALDAWCLLPGDTIKIEHAAVEPIFRRGIEEGEFEE